MLELEIIRVYKQIDNGELRVACTAENPISSHMYDACVIDWKTWTGRV